MKNLKNKKSGFTLIEILVVIGIIAILAAIVIIAINPARQFKQARDTQRTANVNAILNAIGQYTAFNKGTLPSGITSSLKNVSSSGADICDDLVPDYMPALTADPDVTGGAMSDGQIDSSECGGTYDTGYTVQKDSNGRVTVTAPNTELITPDISVTR
jgi:prepilin-type N-terminal cleavage/methylation domain-containing protein